MASAQNQEGRGEMPNHPGNRTRYRAADPTVVAKFASGDRSKRLIGRGTWGLRRIKDSSADSITSDNICHIK